MPITMTDQERRILENVVADGYGMYNRIATPALERLEADGLVTVEHALTYYTVRPTLKAIEFVKRADAP